MGTAMRWLGLLPLLMVACTPAAGPPVAEARVAAAAPVLVEAFDAAQIARLVAPMDYAPTGQVGESSEANASVDFKGPDGETWRAEARHCASHRPGVRCEGITLTARIAVPKSTPAQMLDHANRFNQDQAAVFMFEDAGDLVGSDDIILDGGISEANLEVSLATFSTVLRQNRDFLLRAAGVIP
jgi:Putative bacterial sensory transduction regulator